LDRSIDHSSDIALYLQIKEVIREMIESGELKPGERLPTEFELARHFDVSRITVRQAILGLVDEGYLFRQARRGTFVRELQKTGKGHPRIIGLIVPNIGYSFFADLIEKIEAKARKAGYTIMLCATGNVLERVIVALKSLSENGVKKIIYVPIQTTDYEKDNLAVIREIMKFQMDYVLLDRYVIGVECSYVVSDNFQGAYEATKYLISLGHKNIAMLSNLTSTSVADRLAGFSSAMREAGLHIPRDSIAEVFGPKAEEMAYHQTMKILQNIKPTALIGINDSATIGAYRAVVDTGLSVPEDVSIISFDDVNASDVSMRFTIVKQSTDVMGKTVVKILLEQGEDQKPRQVVLPTELVIGNSCGQNKYSSKSMNF